MPPARGDRDALELFQGALEIPEPERAAWLRESTGGDDDLISEVEALLSAHARTSGILDRRPFNDDVGVLREDQIEPVLREALADRYEIREELGRGGMALVFLARERKHDRTVVIKALKPGVAYLYGAERFEREVQIAAQLSHPHILGLIDSGSDGGVLYYVMPHVAGETLRDRLKREGALAFEAAEPLLEDIANALAYAHAHGVVHRDLKPGNVLCAGTHAYLMDFGIAKTLDEDREQLTGLGHAVGTPSYMAPEQAGADPEIDERADLYAWGLLAYEMLTGSRVEKTKGAVGVEIRERLREASPSLSDGWIELIARCLEPEPSARVASADEILLHFQTADRMSARRSQRSRPAIWRRWWVPTAAVVILAAGTILAWPRGPSFPDGGAPVAVAPFVNETGDASLDPLGNLAADWIAQGVQQLGTLPVLPWPTVLDASRAAAEDGLPTDMVSYLAREIGAGIVITGSFYDLGDEIQFGAAVTDAATGERLMSPSPISAPRDRAETAIRELRDRIMGSFAVASDERLAAVPLSREPPKLEAYRTFDRGIRLYNEQDYSAASREFANAFHQDTTFIVALLYQATTLYNTGRHAEVDSVLRLIEPSRERLTQYQDNRWEFLRSTLDGDGERALRIARRAVEMGPGSRAAYNYGLTAIHLNRPAEAFEALTSVDPEGGAMRGWAQYWTQLSHATHLLGLFDQELAAATAMREGFPERRVASVLQARALAAAGNQDSLGRLLDGIAALSPRTYWSFAGALVISGEELSAHGYAEDAGPYFERAIDWLGSQLAAEPSDRPHRYWLASAYYDLGRWPEARQVFEGLVADYPERRDYRGLAALAIAQMGEPDSALTILGDPPRFDSGDHVLTRARLESIFGNADRALDLFSEALDRGTGAVPWLHASALRDLWQLSDRPRFQQLLARSMERP